MTTYHLSGRIIERTTPRGVPNLRVEALDSEGRCSDLIAVAITDSQGAFTLSVDDTTLDELFPDRRPLLALLLFNGTQQLDAAPLRWTLVQEQTSIRLEVNLSAQGEQAPTTAVVRGQLRTTSGAPLANHHVFAFDQNLLTEEQLGEATTDERGCYQITYSSIERARAGKIHPDLVVRTHDTNGAVVAESPRFCHAPPTLTVDLNVGGEYVGPCEYQQVSQRVAPAITGFDLAGATEDDIARIACSSREDPARISALASAMALAQGTDIPVEIFYGLLREGLPSDRYELLQTPPAQLQTALENAIDKNIICAEHRGALDPIMELLRSEMINVAFEPPPEGATGNLGDLLAITLPAVEVQREFLGAYLSHTGSIEEFWTSLAQRPSFQQGTTIADLQFTLQLGALTRYHFPLLRELKRRRDVHAIHDLRDLATYSEADWRAVLDTSVDGQPIGFPANIPGETNDEKEVNYISVLIKTLEVAFPTVAIAAGMSRSGDNALASFFGQNPSFEFGKTRVGAYLANNSVTLNTAEIARLKRLERLFRVTPHYSEMQPLLQDGIDSAQAIRRLGKDTFVSKYATALGGVESAVRLFENACQISAGALAIFSRFSASLHAVSPYALPNMTLPASNNTGDFADWSTLFGSPDTCACDHCRSVYGPGAYLVDLLEFLDRYPSKHQKTNGTYWTAKEVLIGGGKPGDAAIYAGRRPDIARIELSCANADTPLPYVDLVNEILEHAVAAKVLTPVTVPFPDHIATEGTAAELRALPAPLPKVDGQPEVRPAAYTALAEQVYPWTLPFDFPLEQARVYLNHLGVPRHELMRVLLPEGADITAQARIAGEQLGLSERDRQVVTGVPITTPKVLDDQDYWWFEAAPQDWDAQLQNVPVFLKQSGLTYDELRELLDTKFIQNFGTDIKLVTPAGVDACKIDQMTISGLDTANLPSTWAAVHRFLRLQRRSGYTIRELDRVFSAFNLVRIDDGQLQTLATVQRLRAALGAPLPIVLSWFGDLDTHRTEGGTKPSFYEQVFQNKAIKNPPDSFFDVDTVTSPPSPPQPLETIEGHADVILGALGISASELALLTNNDVSQAEIGMPTMFADTTLSLANLSMLYRIVTFARALRLSIRDFRILQRVSGLVPFKIDHAQAFVEMVQRVQRSGLKPADLLYLFAHHESPATSLALSDASIDVVLAPLDTALLKLAEDWSPDTLPTSERLQDLLDTLYVDEETRKKAFQIINKTSTSSAADQESFFDEHMAAFFSNPADAKAKLIDTATQQSFADNVALFSTQSDANVVPASFLEEAEDRIVFAFTEMSAAYVAREQRNLIKAALAAKLGIEVKTAELLITSMLTVAAGSSDPLLNAFLQPATNINIKVKQGAYRHLHKAVLIVQRLGMTPEEVERFVGSGDARLFDVNALPRLPAAPDTQRFQDWQTLVDLWALKPSLHGEHDVLLDLFGALKDSDLTGLNQMTGWPAEDISFLLGSQGLNIPVDTAPAQAKALLRLRDAFGALGRLGAAAEKALAWTGADVALAEAEAIVQMAKAKYGEAAWAKIAPPLRDVLREQQRRSLVAYLIAANGYTDSDDLFADLLVDVEMSPCQLTSRIKQAIGSVQTFAQRALLNLEKDDVELPEDAAREWTWRKSYRVWEANRKIFLYPENWIDPSLRDDKSPFFKELENELRQKDITNEAAELALSRYLEKLDQVAHLDVVAMYHQVDASDATHPAVDVLHVIGRTRHTPSATYYRRRIDGAYWTPWEKLELDIAAEQLLLTVHNRRLYLFWPLIQERPDSEQPKPPPATADVQTKPKPQALPPWMAFIQEILDKQNNTQSASTPTNIDYEPKTHLEIKLAFSEYRSGKWSPKQVSDESIITVSPAVDARWISLVREVFTSFSPTPPLKITALFNPYPWGGMFQNSLARLGTFSLGACGKVMSSTNKGWAFELTKNGKYSAARKENDPAGPLPGFQDMVNLLGPNWSTMVGQESVEAFNKNTPGGERPLNLPIVIAGKTQWVNVLGRTPYGRFHVLTPHAIDTQFDERYKEAKVLFYKNDASCFFAELDEEFKTTWIDVPMPRMEAPVTQPNSGGLSVSLNTWLEQTNASIRVAVTTEWRNRYRFHPFYHPYVCAFVQELNRGGVSGLFGSSVQSLSRKDFVEEYMPVPTATKSPYPVDEVDFSFGGAYALYNWELFFHAPFLIATRLMENQRFEEAQKWFHYIFDPTAGGPGKVPARFWKLRSFAENLDLDTIQQELAQLGQGADSPAVKMIRALLGLDDGDPDKVELAQQITAWQKSPFNPHLVARMRPLAYQKAVVQKYIQNLIAWGDQLFLRDTIESINEATQLYILAANLLGKKPARVRRDKELAAQTYAELDQAGLDAFSNALVEVEGIAPLPAPTKAIYSAASPLPDLRTQYFCVPGNDMLLDLWDTVADRLFKIRHCMNIEGVVRELPLFEPPIDPALLVQAAAAGVDLTTALNDIGTPLPHYRFTVMHQKAMELCGSVIGLGGAILSAIEKRDAEGLALLRSRQEIDLLRAVREAKEQQIEEARTQFDALERSLESAQIRHEYYAKIPKLSVGELVTLEMSGAALTLGAAGQILMATSATSHKFPATSWGAAGALGSPLQITGLGAQNVAASSEADAQAINMSAGIIREGASIAGTLASYDRSWQEWKLQEKLAATEIKQIGKQIAAAKIRVAIAERELDNHDRQIENARAVDEYMKTKATNEELYDWMIGELSGVYFQSYKMAYEVAKKAERAFRFERGLTSSNYITFGYWDNLRRGLLAGEKLQHDLRRMEIAYLDQNKREYELTKHVSLLLHDPTALMTLRATGTCEIALPEELFDMDYPGHYFRRIKSVSLTIPGVSGPFSSVNCTLTLTRNRIRAKSEVGAAYVEEPSNDSRFLYDFAQVQRIATSHGQNDGGLFEVNFRDERYLPFEGAGAISTWTLKLPRDRNSLDVEQLSDVVLRISYTAREGGDGLRTAAESALDAKLEADAMTNPPTPRLQPPLQQLVSGARDLPAEWYKFLNVADSEDKYRIGFTLDKGRLPHVLRDKTLQVTHVDLYAIASATPGAMTLVSPDNQAVEPLGWTQIEEGSRVYCASPALGSSSASGTWTITASAPVAVDDLLMVFTVAL